MFHINPETGRPNQCKAKTPEACKFYNKETGEFPRHFNTKAEAREHYEWMMQDDELATSVTKKKATTNAPVKKVDHVVPEFGSIPTRFKDNKKGTPYMSLSEGYGEKNTLGLHTATIEGIGVGDGKYDAVQVTGIINHNNLDENSYKQFGFKGPDESRVADLVGIFEGDTYDVNDVDLENIDTREADSISAYTDDEIYRVFNKELRNKSEFKNEYVFEEGNMTVKDNHIIRAGYEDPDENIEYESEGSDNIVINRATYQNTIRSLDKTLAHSSGVQRTVYRGSMNYLLPNGDNLADMEIGQEMKADSFTSTSIGCGNHLTHFNTDRIVMEIKTGSGAAIYRHSNVPDEGEVVIPRGSRFMLVGKHAVDYHTVNDKGFYDNIVGKRPNVILLQMVEINEKGEVVDHNNIKETNKMREESNFKEQGWR